MTPNRLTAVVAVVALGGIRLIYQRFYTELGIGFDEVGLSTWQMTVAAAADWVGLVALAAPAMWAGQAIHVALANTRGHERLGFTLTAGTATFVVTATVLGQLPYRQLEPVLTLVGIVLVSVGVFSYTDAGSPGLRRWAGRIGRPSIPLVAALAVGMWVGGYVNAGDAAASLGPSGAAKQDPLVMTIIDVPRHPVCVESVAPDVTIEPRLLSSPLLLLGGARGTTLLLDVERDRPIVHRIPSSALVLRGRAPLDDC
jgi:hypothetical protein